MLMGRSQRRGNSPEGMRAMGLCEGMGLRAGAGRISLRQKEGHLFHGIGTKAENSAVPVGLVAGSPTKTFP